MKPVKLLLAMAMVLALSSGAFAYDSGSTGEDGDFQPTGDTVLKMPEDGVFNFAIVNIPAGVTVTFEKNAANTPVYILATNDVTIEGTIDVSGKPGLFMVRGEGGPGGFDGGYGTNPYKCGPDGLGPGGGKGGIQHTDYNHGAGGSGGGFGSSGSKGVYNSWSGYPHSGAGGEAYGKDTLVPIIGGSGGSGGCSTASSNSGAGGGGGGAILIASSKTITLDGLIRANGGNGGKGAAVGDWGNSGGGGGAGSGGGIRLVADTITGSGMLRTVGGNGGGSWDRGCCWTISGGTGGVGRIRLEAENIFFEDSSPAYSYQMAPSAALPADVPSLNIVSIGGISVPADAAGKLATPDIILPHLNTNVVEVIVEASKIPAGTTVELSAVPELGNTATAIGNLVGSDESSSVTISIALPHTRASVLMATAQFTLQVASTDTPIYADGERVVEMKVVASLGGGSRLSYITESGREVPAI